MIIFNKKQVKALIDILNSEPCKTRPALQTIRIKRDGHMYITNKDIDAILMEMR